MKKEDIDKLLTGRKLIDDHKNRNWQHETDEEHTEATLKMTKGLADLGFDSIEKFSTFNGLMCYDAYRDSVPIEGSCDGCKDITTPGCIEKYGDKACCNLATEESRLEAAYKLGYKSYMQGRSVRTGDKIVSFATTCPEGKGYFSDAKKRKEFPFDLRWKVR